MENKQRPDRSNVYYVKRPRRLVSRTRIVMGLLLIVAVAIFVGFANKAVRENAEDIRQSFGPIGHGPQLLDQHFKPAPPE
jgi:hypothetical protein